MNLKMKQSQFKFISGIVFTLLALALSACTQAPGLATGDFNYSGVGGSGWDQQSSSGGLNVYPSNSVIGTSGTLQLAASGGVPPYVYSIMSGNGTLNPDSGFFQASTIAGSVQIEVRDLRGNIGYANIVVSTGVGSNAGGVGNGALNYPAGLVTVSVSSAGCPAGGWSVGTIQNTADVRTACILRSNVSATTTVVAEAAVTAGGSHTMNPSCPAGFTTVGSMPDCYGGSCSGTQNFCAKLMPASAVTQYVSNLYVTSSGVHSPTGPGCPSGFTNVGTVVDCGGNFCSGYQNFCRSLNATTN
jgi:hypothetical protein